MGTDLAKTSANGGQTLVALNNWDPKLYNSLMPLSVGELSDIYSVRYFTVQLSPDPNDGDVYPESGRLALRKRALNLLADALGIVWDTRNCRRVDDMKDDDVVVFQVVGGVLRPDGTFKAVTGTKEINLRDLAKNGESEANLKQIRKHKTRLAESKAYLAAIRSLTNLKSTYTAEEIKKPFVAAQVYVDPAKDREVARLRRLRAVQDVRELFGPDDSPRRLGPGKAVATPVNAVPVTDEDDWGDEAVTIASDQPGEITASEIPAPHEEIAAKEDGIRKLEWLALQKGKEVVGWFAFTYGHPLEEGSVDELVDAIDKVSRWPDFKPAAKGRK